MNTAQRYRPRVPSVPSFPDHGSGQTRRRDRGALVNPWATAGCHTYLDLATYNIRSLSSDDRMAEFEEEVSKIKWDIIGLAEVRRLGEECLTLKSGHTLYFRGNEISRSGGVGFLVNKKISTQIIRFKSISERVIYLIFKISARYTLKVIQVYAPTSSHDDVEFDEFLDDIAKGLEESPTNFTFIMGDLNAKLGKRETTGEIALGGFGIGTRNNRGSTFLNFLHQRKLFAMNTFFEKKQNRKWTWISPDGNTRNEIDYILSDNKNVVKDVSVLNSFSTGSDHRLVRAKVKINI